MEAVLLHSSTDQSISPYKQFRNPKRNNRPLISQRSENFTPSNFHGGLLHAPHPSVSFFSYPPPISLLNQQQPPLLPLPIPNPPNKGLSCPPINRKIKNKARAQFLTPKKSKPTTISPEKADSKQDLKSPTTTSSECVVIASTNPSGPDPKDLPKHVSRVFSSSSSSAGSYSDSEKKFSDSSEVFSLSPPPSSLPLPTFFLRPKLSCNAKASGIDAGATDNLRRILRLR